ncbi:beta strand repeat-containing protein [Fuerstiella marisgermanici]|uniref:beta strand repeat-containing protein n=1 Tax=Fuerstiella marisgermanici TaxID=1891926 RepID=UPI00097C574A|nr:PKD domain-containing protein [Fuerstiella marisgermanici]
MHSAEHSQRLAEILEDRCLLATIVWDGAPDGGGSSANADWSNDDNWAGDIAPTTNDDLVFPDGAAQPASVNDFVGATFGSILIEGDNYSLGGQPIVLNGSITIQGTDNAVDMDLQLGLSSGIANTGSGTFTVNGTVDLNGNDLSVSNSGGGQVSLNDAISGTGGVSFSGNGTAVLATGNSYTGETLVSGGTLIVLDAAGLGTADGTAATGTRVINNSYLQIENSITVADELLTSDDARVVSVGDNVWTGGMTTVSSDYLYLWPNSGSSLQVDGNLTPYRLDVRYGDVILNGAANTSYYNYVRSGGTLEVDGTYTNYYYTYIQNSVLDVDGTYSNQYYDTNVQSGSTLDVSGTFSSGRHTYVQGGALVTGTGTVNAGTSGSNYQLRVQSGGTIDPGSTSTTGVLNTSDIYFEHANSNFDVQLNGTTAGTEYDQLKVNGTVRLDGHLNVTLLASLATIGDEFIIIDNDGTDPVDGFFVGLPESGLVEFGGNIWSISYAGGTGNDVVLTTQTVNQFPTGDPQSITTNEETAVNITLTGSDTDGDPITFSIESGPSNGTLSVSGANLTYTPDLNFAGSDSFEFRVTDDLGGFSTAMVSIHVVNTKDPPTLVSLSDSSVDENTPIGTAVGTLSTEDPDVGDTFTYTLAPGSGDTDNASFGISGDQLTISAAPGFETKSSYSVRVRSTDAAGDFVEGVFSVSINDVNEAPTALSLSPSAVDENSPSGTVVGTLVSTDEDAGDSHSYLLVPGTASTHNSLFTIDGNQLKTAFSPDFELQNSYSIRVRSTDSGSLSHEQSLVVSINDINEAPSIDSGFNLTPEWLEANAVFSAPHALDSGILFPGGRGSSQQKLFSSLLVDADQLSTAGPHTISVTIDYERLTGDNDPHFGITDGQDVVGLRHVDNSGGRIDVFEAADGTVLSSRGLQTIASGVPIQTPNLLEFDIVVDADTAVQNIRINGTPFGGQHSTSRKLNAKSGLSLVMFAGDPGEQYRLNGATVSITSAPVNEGDTARHSGTFTDVDGDIVSVAATDAQGQLIGAVTLDSSSPGSGLWNWTYDTTDGPDENQAITVTATDEHGATDTATFDLLVNNVAPTFDIFDEDLSAEDLLADAAFFVRSATLGSDGQSSYLDIGQGANASTSEPEKILQVPLADAGSNVDRIVLSIEAPFVSVTGDDDLGIAITDGTNVIGLVRGDNNGGQMYVREWTDNGADGLQTNSQLITPGNNIGFPTILDVEIHLSALQTVVTGTSNGFTGTATSASVLDPNAALSLVLMGNNAQETYRIRSISATVHSELSVSPNPVDEGSEVTLTGTFADPGAGDEHTIEVNWGDGNTTNHVLPVGDRTFSIPYTYADDDPTGTASDEYTISVSISDDDGGVSAGDSSEFEAFNNGAAVPLGGGEAWFASQSSGWKIYDQFSLSQQTLLSSALLQVATEDSNLSQFEFGIFAKSGSHPGAPLSNFIFSPGDYVATQNGIPKSFSGIGWNISFDFPAPVDLPAGDYFIGFQGLGSTRLRSLGTGSGDGFIQQQNSNGAFVSREVGNGNIPFVLTAMDVGQSATTNIMVNNVAPTATVTAPSTAGQNQTVNLSANVSDPGTDSFTYNWTVTLPTGGSIGLSGATPSFQTGGDGNYQVDLTVTDDDGGSGSASLQIVVDDEVPTITSVTTDDGTDLVASGILPEGTNAIDIRFSEVVENTTATHKVVLQRAGSDGLLGTSDDPVVTLSNVTYTGLTATVVLPSLPEDIYRLTVSDDVVDTAGNALDGDTDGVAGDNFTLDLVGGPAPTHDLTSPNGFTFDPEIGGWGAGQLVQGTNNAFDGLNRLEVSGTAYLPSFVEHVETPAGASYTGYQMESLVHSGGLTVSQTIELPSDGSVDISGFIRMQTEARPMSGLGGGRLYIDGQLHRDYMEFFDGQQVNSFTGHKLPFREVLHLSAGTHTIELRPFSGGYHWGGTTVVPLQEWFQLDVMSFSQPSVGNGSIEYSGSNSSHSGLEVHRKVTTPSTGSEDFARTLDVFHNPTSGDVTTTARLIGNLGSDANTVVFATSDGDTIVEPTDWWIGTDDGDGSGAPAVIHYIHGPGTSLQPNQIALSGDLGDNIDWTYDLTVPAGETVRLAHFTITADTRAAAITAANALVIPDGFANQAAAFLSDGELDSIANFVFNTPPQADAGGPYTADEGSSFTLDASASTDNETASSGLTFQWDLDYDGSTFDVDATGEQPSVSFPDDFATRTIAVRVTDPDGEFDLGTTTLTVANVAPTPLIDSISLVRQEGTQVDVSASATDPAGANDMLTYSYQVLKDGSAYDSGSGVDQTSFSFTPDDNGSYDIVVTVSDEDGGSSTVSQTITVDNGAPDLVLDPVISIDENGTAILTGTITDPGTLDTFTLDINWGDALSPNDTEQYTFAASASGTQTFTLTHQYLDDNPTSDPSNVYTINASVTDNDTGTGSDVEAVTVNNVAPTLGNLSITSPIDENDTATLTGDIVDPGTLDTFTLTVDWGDGSPVETFHYAAGTTSFSE